MSKYDSHLKCSFCGNEIEPGTGKLYAKKDGTVFNFCKNKCQKNMLKLKTILTEKGYDVSELTWNDDRNMMSSTNSAPTPR